MQIVLPSGEVTWLGEPVIEQRNTKIIELIAYYLTHKHLPDVKVFRVPNIYFNLEYGGVRLYKFNRPVLQHILYQLMTTEEDYEPSND